MNPGSPMYVQISVSTSRVDVKALQHDSLVIYTCCLGFQGLFYFIGGKFEQSFHAKWICLFGIAIFLLGIGGSIFATTLFEYALYSGVLCGTGYGLSFISSLSICIQWFPSRSGSITGIVIMGLGVGQLIFSQLGIIYVLLYYIAESRLRQPTLFSIPSRFSSSKGSTRIPRKRRMFPCSSHAF